MSDNKKFGRIVLRSERETIQKLEYLSIFFNQSMSEIIRRQIVSLFDNVSEFKKDLVIKEGNKVFMVIEFLDPASKKKKRFMREIKEFSKKLVEFDNEEKAKYIEAARQIVTGLEADKK